MKAVRIYPAEASEYGLRQLKLKLAFRGLARAANGVLDYIHIDL